MILFDLLTEINQLRNRYQLQEYANLEKHKNSNHTIVLRFSKTSTFGKLETVMLVIYMIYYFRHHKIHD